MTATQTHCYYITPHRKAQMQPIATYVAHSKTCPRDGQTSQPCKNGWTNWVPFGGRLTWVVWGQTRVGLRNYVLNRAHTSTTWWIQLNDLWATVVRPRVKLQCPLIIITITSYVPYSLELLLVSDGGNLTLDVFNHHLQSLHRCTVHTQTTEVYIQINARDNMASLHGVYTLKPVVQPVG